MKKIVSCFLSIFLVIGGTCSSFASEVSYEDAYNFLTENGVSHEFLATMEAPDVIGMYNDLKDKNITQVDYETTELCVDEETGELVPLTEYDLPTSKMTLSFSAITTSEAISSSKSKIVDVKVYATYVWKKRPAVNRGDMATIDWNTLNFAFKAGTYTHKVYYTEGSDYTLWKKVVKPTKAEQGGIGIAIPFYNTQPAKMKGIITFNLGFAGGTMYHYTDSDKNTRTTTLNMNYVHDGTPAVTGIVFASASNKVSIQATGSVSKIYSTSASSSIKYAKK